MEFRDTVFSCRQLTKSFKGTLALKGVDVDVYAGEVIGLIGENGAGKSTLLKIIMGFQPQTSGEMSAQGKPFAPATTREANANGIAMVYQEQSLILNLTVAENLFMGMEDEFIKCGILNSAEMGRRATEVLKEFGLEHIKPSKKVLDLNFSTRQMLEIVKAFNAVKMANVEHSLILLDEPTSLLNDAEIRVLFEKVRKLRDAGHSFIFVSHRLDEVISLSDRVYVFKDGEMVSTLPTRDADESRLYELMVGRDASGEYYKIHEQREPEEAVVLDVQHLGKKGYFKDVSFQLHRGEILGLCGVVGAGKEDVCAVILGDEKADEGTITIEGQVRMIRSPYEALNNGIISIPKERRVEGIVGIRPIFENIALPSLDRIGKESYISKKDMKKCAEKWIEKLAIKCTGADQTVDSLSGGNAQKVVFAKAIEAGSSILILNHPTRGVDIGAKEEIYSLIREISNMGISIVLLGDTLDECIGLSNHLIIMKDGLITKAMPAPKDAKPSQVEVLKYMM